MRPKIMEVPLLSNAICVRLESKYGLQGGDFPHALSACCLPVKPRPSRSRPVFLVTNYSELVKDVLLRWEN